MAFAANRDSISMTANSKCYKFDLFFHRLCCPIAFTFASVTEADLVSTAFATNWLSNSFKTAKSMLGADFFLRHGNSNVDQIVQQSGSAAASTSALAAIPGEREMQDRICYPI